MKVLRPLVHLLVPLCVHWVAEEMTQSVLLGIAATAPSSYPGPIYINAIQQTVVGIFKMGVLPFLGQLSDNYGRKPLLLLTCSTTIFPFALLAINKSRGFVYAYYVMRTISNIVSQGSIFCIAIAYAADVIPEGNRAAAFSWITGTFSASQVLGNVLAQYLHENYNVFEVALFMLIFVPLYMALHLEETVIPDGRAFPYKTNPKKFLQEQYFSIRFTLRRIVCSPTLKCICVVSFFYQLGMSGINTVLPYYLKAAFGFEENQLCEVLMVVGVGSVVSQMVVLPLVNPFVGEKLILCTALVASIAYALLYGLAWASWVTYLSASFGAIYVLVIPSIYAVVSRASSSDDQGKAQGFIAGVQSMATSLSPIAMRPLTTWFLSENAPFNCKGFTIICASLFMIVALCCACTLKLEPPPETSTGDNVEDRDTPLLS